MKQLSLFIFGVLLFLPTVSFASQTPDNLADLAEKLLPTVVNISTTQTVTSEEQKRQFQPFPFPEFRDLPEGSPFGEFFKEFFEDRFSNPEGNGTIPDQQRAEPREYKRPNSLGSGFVIDAKEGYIVTNNHVIAGADEIKVILHDDTTLDATLVGKDDKTDVAVLKVETDVPLQAAQWGDSDSMRVGNWVMAIGNPFGLGGTVTAGIISARQRDINAGPYDDFLQTDASINRGNSGGPMFNLSGEVIGINTAIYSPSGGSVGIGFAVPSDSAKPVVRQLIKYGHTRRGWLGVRIQMVTDEIAESLELSETKGAMVASVTEDGPAQKAGVKAGDVILTFDGQDIPSMRRLPRVVADTEIGKLVTMTVWRNGKAVTLNAKIGELERAEKNGLLDPEQAKEEDEEALDLENKSFDKLGLTLSNVNDVIKERYAVPKDVQGVLIVDVIQGSEAYSQRLSEGDMITEVNQQVVTSVNDFSKALKKTQKENKKSVLLLVNRGGTVRFVALKLL